MEEALALESECWLKRAAFATGLGAGLGAGLPLELSLFADRDSWIASTT